MATVLDRPQINLANVKTSITAIIEAQLDKINTMESSREIFLFIRDLFDKHNIDTKKSREIIRNLATMRNVENARAYIYNFCLKGEGQGTLEIDKKPRYKSKMFKIDEKLKKIVSEDIEKIEVETASEEITVETDGDAVKVEVDPKTAECADCKIPAKSTAGLDDYAFFSDLNPETDIDDIEINIDDSVDSNTEDSDNVEESKSIKEEYIEATPNDKDCFAFITTINKRTRETKRQRIEGSYGKIRGIIASKQRNETLYDFEGPFKNESKSIKESNDVNPDIWKAIGRHFDYIIAEKAAEILENLVDRALMQDNVEDTYEAVIRAIDDGLFNNADIWEINALYDECELSDNAYSCLIDDLVAIVDAVRTGDLNEGLNLTESAEKQYVAIDTQDKDNKDNNRKYTEKQLIDFAKELIKIEEESSEPDQYKKRPELKDDLASAKKVLKYFMYDVKEAE